ncbi:formate dehydrogenase subunit delta [Pokkaliibacter sp. MBI-7]|uniref:formate dehydrogenase subunit delta n=1 Tax=Pokkaliibacter sp. MBI-7 TaxID=3040600 RepID=UPI002448DDEE|nr:formate dehydrogenase subunit delta [Pokkaliibacter sp. MBI-7]MDH2432023.1 formate dehydrogenase subunit delta [Pokkaliibacter sp. MBI-7]
MKAEYLIKMANQIALNLAYEQDHDRRADKVAGHIKKFWEPRMIEVLLAVDPAHPELSPCVVIVLSRL